MPNPVSIRSVELICRPFSIFSSRVLDPFCLQCRLLSLFEIPSGAGLFIKTLHAGVFLGRCMVRIRRRVNYPFQAVLGEMLDAALGGERFMQTVATIVRLSRIMLSLTEETGHFIEDSKRFSRALSVPRWETIHTLSNETEQEGAVAEVKKQLSHRCGVIGSRAFPMIKSMLKTSELFFELYDLFTGDPSVVRDLFVEVSMISEMLSEDRLVEALRIHGQWVDRTLELFGSKYRSGAILKRLERVAAIKKGVDVVKSVTAQTAKSSFEAISTILPSTYRYQGEVHEDPFS